MIDYSLLLPDAGALFMWLVVGIGVAWVIVGIVVIASVVRHVREERRRQAAEQIWSQFPDVEIDR